MTKLTKTAYVVVFLVTAFFGSVGLPGHMEPHGSSIYAPVIILIFGILAVTGRFPKLSVHLAWASVCAAAVLFTYRMYCYEKQNAEIYSGELHHDEQQNSNAMDRLILLSAQALGFPGEQDFNGLQAKLNKQWTGRPRKEVVDNFSTVFLNKGPLAMQFRSVAKYDTIRFWFPDGRPIDALSLDFSYDPDGRVKRVSVSFESFPFAGALKENAPNRVSSP